jgi:hypothetical protein
MYNVFNPLTGMNTKCETLEEVQQLTSDIINQFISQHQLVVNIIDVKANGDEEWITIQKPSVRQNIQVIGVDPNLTQEQRLAWIIEERDARLTACDWTQLPDVTPLHDETWLTNWKSYRQALRDLPLTLDIDNPVFPVPPL